MSKKQQLHELQVSMLTAEKLLNESRLSAEEYRSKGDVLAAELDDRQEILKMLLDVVDKKMREKKQLHHKINKFEGQLVQLSETASNRNAYIGKQFPNIVQLD